MHPGALCICIYAFTFFIIQLSTAASCNFKEIDLMMISFVSNHAEHMNNVSDVLNGRGTRRENNNYFTTGFNRGLPKAAILNSRVSWR